MKLSLQLGTNWFLYSGSKCIYATPMNRADYNEYRGWELPSDENGQDDGFLVEYVDGGRTNHKDHRGYISWSPKDVFEKTYRKNGSLTFGDALVALKAGHKVARTGWNGKDMYVVAQQGQEVESTYVWNPHNKAHAEKLGGWIKVTPYCTLKTAQDTLAMGWVPSTGDLFAEDWLIL